MCRVHYRNLYAKKDTGEISVYSLSYVRIDERELTREYYQSGSRMGSGGFFEWLRYYMISLTDMRPHIETIRKCADKFELASVQGMKAYWKGTLGNKSPTPRYVTILSVSDKDGAPVSGGSAVCSGMDVPDRRLGYRVAFDAMKDDLINRLGLTIVSRNDAMPILEQE